MLKTTRIRAISITALPAWDGRKEGLLYVNVQSVDERGQTSCQDVKVDNNELHRVLLAQKALIRRIEG